MSSFASSVAGGASGGGLRQSEAAKTAQLIAAVREKAIAVERNMDKAMHTPIFITFQAPCQRIQSLSRLLSRAVSSLVTPSQRICAVLYSLLGALRLIHAAIAPFTRANAPPHFLVAHARNNGALLARKLESVRRLYAVGLHDLNQALLGEIVELRMQQEQNEDSTDDGANTPAPSTGRPTVVLPQKQFLSASAVLSSGEGEFLGHVSHHGTLSSPIRFEDSYFGDDSASPYAVEKAMASRMQEMKDLLLTYRELPSHAPLNAACSFAQGALDETTTTKTTSPTLAGRAPPPYCLDVFSPLHSTLSLPLDFVDNVRSREFSSLRAAFARLCVSYAGGAHVDSNRSGPRVIFIHGEAGLGGQEYAKYVLHHLLEFIPPPPSTVKPTDGHSAAETTQIPRTPQVAFAATAPPSYTSDYTPLHFAFNRHSQYAFKRRTESLLDSLARTVKRGLASTPESDADPHGEVGVDGASVISSGAATATTSASVGGSHRSSLTSGSGAAGSGRGRSAIPPFEKEKLDTMHRLRVDALTVIKSLLSGLTASVDSVGSGGSECESGAYASDVDLLAKYRTNVLDAPVVLLLSNVHKNDEEEIEKLLFPSVATPIHPHRHHQAVIIVQSRQPLKSLIRRCDTHAIVQQLKPMDQTQTMHAVMRISERRVQLRGELAATAHQALTDAAHQRKQEQALSHTPSRSTRSPLLSPPLPLTPAFLPPVLPAHLCHVLDPGHAIRLASLSRGSIFVAKLLVRNVEAGMPSRPTDGSAGRRAGRVDPTDTGSPPRATAEWLCTGLESRPSVMERYLTEHYFPSSAKSTVAPAISFLFAQALSESARALFVGLCFALSGCASFTLRTLKATFMHYELRGGLATPDEVDADVTQTGRQPVFRLGQLEADLRELCTRGFVHQSGEFNPDAYVVDEDHDEETDSEGAVQSRTGSVSEVADADGETADPSDPALPASPSRSLPPCPLPVLPLSSGRFFVPEVLKEFGLSVSHSTPNSAGAGEFAKFFGEELTAKFLTRDTSERYKRGLQLNFVAHISHAVAAMEVQYRQWWHGRDREGQERGEDEEGDEDGDEEEMNDEQTGADSGAPTEPTDASSHVSTPPRRSPPTSRSVQIQSRSGASPDAAPASSRSEILRHRASVRSSVTLQLLASEREAAAAVEANRRTSFSRSSGRSNPTAPAGDARRSTLLLASRQRNETSTLPPSSFRSLPHAKPTELVYKTVRKLRALQEDDENTEETMAGEPDSTNDAVGRAGDESPLADEVDVRPTRCDDDGSSSDGSDNGDREDGLEDDSQSDSDLCVIPFADADDADPESAITMTPATIMPKSSLASPRNGTAVNSDPIRPSGSFVKFSFAFDDLQSVLDAEQAEDIEARARSRRRSIGAGARRNEPAQYDAADFPDSDESDDSDTAADEEDDESDDGYEEVSDSDAVAMQAAASSESEASLDASTSDVIELLHQMNEADRRNRRAIRARERALAARLRREDEEARRLEHSEDVVNHGRSALPTLFQNLKNAVPLGSLGMTGTSAQPALGTLATAVMHALLPRAVRTTRATVSPGSRARSGTTFSPSAIGTPSFIRSLQLSGLLRQFDLDLSSVLLALRYSHSCPRTNLSAVSLFAPKRLYTARLSADLTKHTYFHYLEVSKPRYSHDWLRALWHLGECYKAMGLLQKARDCLEEIRLIAVRQGTEGVAHLVTSQVGVAAVHQAQIAAGRMAHFGAWIDTRVDAAGETAPESKLALMSAQGSFANLAYPSTPLHGGDSGTLTASGSSLSTQSFSLGGAIIPPSELALATPFVDAGRVHGVLDAILDCYERALATLEANSLLLLSDRLTAADAGLGLGVHSFNRAFMFLFLRLGTFYTYKAAYQNAINSFRRLVEMKAAEVDDRRQRRQRRREERRRGEDAYAEMSSLSPDAAADRAAAVSAIFPFTLPCTTRMFASACFGIGLVHFRTGDLNEALDAFERARRVAAAIVHRRWRREKRHRDHAARLWPLVEPGREAGQDEDADTESAWLYSTSFLSAIATPQQAGDIMTYVRCLYMQACTYDRLALLAETSSASPLRVASSSAAPTAGWLTYQAVVLRSKIVSLWHRLAADHKVVTMHEDMWRVAAGMSALEAVQ